ncbi:MAG: bifunctional heptose 7-phosphate kinase/heptose 1-phosphate adenyltransferase [Phycisphaerae bacterium]
MMISDLTHIVRSFDGRRVLVVGDLILDRYVYGDATRISPEAPVPVLRAVEQDERVGGSANVAACLVALGAKVRCMGTIGADTAGQRLRSLLSDLGVDGSGLVVADDRGTSTKTRFVGLAQHRHRQQLLRFDEESTENLPPHTAAKLTAAVTQAVAQVDVVCIEDYAKGLVTSELVQAVVAAARAAGIPVIVDPARLSDYSQYKGVTLVTPNRNELELVAGRPFDSPGAVMETIGQLLRLWDVESAVVTLDRDGAVVARAGREPAHIPTRPRSVYDNTGAGDAVLACLAAAVAADASLEDAVRLANIAGGLEVEKFGCVPITADEMLAELRLEDRRRNGKARKLDELVAELGLRRDRGETVALTNGVYDILHPGHVDLLEKARDEASLLVVAVNSDASAKRLGKGAGRPINDQRFRVRMLEALECVDYVVIFDEPTPLHLIERVRPNVLVKGEDWAVKGVVGREFVESIGGRVRLVPVVEGFSTTSILERIRNGLS